MGRASGLESIELGFDSRSEEALYRRNSGRVFGFCLSQLGRREDAEDALQTTFLHAVRSLRRGVVPLVESAWLVGIARNVCRERWEVAGRRNRVESTCDPQELDRVSAAPEERREELIGLEEALTRLPEQQRRAILLRDWRGLSYDEVAAQLGVSRAAVETLIFRGRGTLAELLREEPRETKRRLAALGNLGSLFTALKTAFTGAAVATKIAAAVSVTAIAVGGASVAITAPDAPAPSKPSAVHTPAPARAPAPVAARPHRSSAPTTVDSRRPRSGAPAPAAKRTTVTKTAAPTRGATTQHPAKPAAAAPSATEHPATPAAATPKAAAATKPVKALVGAAPVQNAGAPPLTGAVETLVQSEVVQTVVATVAPVVQPVVEQVVAPVVAPVVEIVSDVVPPLPPVTVTPPPLLGLPPVTVTPPKLLP